MLNVVTTVSAPAASYNLTDLATVHDELGISTTDTSNDAWLTRAITQVSRAISHECSDRVFTVEALTDTFYFDKGPQQRELPGTGDTLQLSRFPVVSVGSVVILTSLDVTQTLNAGTDYVVDAKKGQLIRLNSITGLVKQWEEVQVTVSYVAGYGATVPESHNVPIAPGPYIVTVLNANQFSIDQGVTYANGTPLTSVSGTPGAGQYAVNASKGQYTFASADAGAGVNINYGCNQIPDDLVYIALRLVTQRFQAKGRDPGLMQRDTPNRGTERWWVGGAPGQKGPFPPDIQGALENYRVPVVA